MGATVEDQDTRSPMQPAGHSRRKLFILDARHGVEERYLREWLRGAWNSGRDG